MSTLYVSICNFLRIALPEHITAFSVIYQAMNEEPWILKDNLRQIFHQAISAIMPSYTPGSEKYLKLLSLPLKFDDAFEGVCSLRDFEVARREEELTIETIEKNLRILKGDLKKSKARYANILRKRLGNVNPSELSWCDPLASQVLSSEMEMVKKLPEDDYKSFMEPVKHMQVALPHSIETVCDDFLTNYDDGSMEIPSQKLSHKNWGEREEVLRDIAVRILDTLGCKLEEKDEFAILRFQVAGRKFNLYVLIRDHERISRLFLLKSVNIPTQFTNDRKAIFEFIETLLLLRRILIVDLSLLFNSVTHESDESSSTMSSPPPN
ncbi:13516_t:CDS:2 [Entrophospora sp. SA101]|nr:13516_t:CDS:2 [Entrophospora sp. SA101]